MGSNWDKFLLLMWKNYKLQLRHPLQTLIEVLAPVMFGIVLVALRLLMQPEVHDEVFFTPFTPSGPSVSDISNIIAWSPSNPILEKIMDNTLNTLNENNLLPLSHRSFRNSLEIDSYLANEVTIVSTLAAVVFDDSLDKMEKLVPNINITLRFPAELRVTEAFQYGSWKTNLLFPLYQDPGPRDELLNEGGLPGYSNEGFLALQQELCFSIIKHLKESQNLPAPSLPSIYMQRFPYPGWTRDKLLKSIQPFIGLIFLMSYIYTCVNIAKLVTGEKENQLKEAMKIMGLPNWLHWAAWISKSIICVTITAVLMVLVLQASWCSKSSFSVFQETNPNVLFLFLLSYSWATIGFAFAVSAFFTSANTAATISGLLWFLLYVPFYFVEGFYDRFGCIEKLATCLCSNSAMAYGFRLILSLEASGKGVQWDNLFASTSQDDQLSVGYIIGMLLFDGILYLSIALYVEAIHPGGYGVPEKWYFPFTYSYWCGWTYSDDQSSNYKPIENDSFEAEPTYLQAGVKIRKLRKQYKGKKVAVADLTLNMYKDQITVLLGHNGAGKTTTMFMLTGMFPPTSGSAIIGGCDIRTNLKGVRESLGLCPQHNILFDELTVREHLYFYSRLKGMDPECVDNEIMKYIRLLELQPKADAKASTLSGGMKRKLSVGVALCGNSKVVMLDEPTAGMDPTARRVIWDLLQFEKKDRTILLTTHFMDEADLLGDRIGIMCGGKLQCCGSSFFLKKKFGAGYHLILDTSSDCDVEKVTAVLRSYIPNIKVESSVGSELTYLLYEEYSYLFEQMLNDLERSAYSLGVNSYGISLTTLEEVFMKVGADSTFAEYKKEQQSENEMQKFEIEDYDEYKNSSVIKLNNIDHSENKWTLWVNQVQAMFMKRSLSLMRNWVILLIQILIPIAFVIFVIIIVTESNTIVDLPKLNMALASYKDPITIVSRDNRYSEHYKNMFKDNKGLNVLENEDIESYLYKKTTTSAIDVRQKYIVAATFHPNQSVTAWFNNVPYHSAPLALQLVINAILHYEFSTEYNIQISNYPFPYALNTQLVNVMEGRTMGFDIASNIAFSMAFVSSFYVLFYVKERVSKSKHLQFVSGMNVIPFWLPSFAMDFCTLLLTFVGLLITLVPFQVDGFSSFSELGRIFLLLIMFGISVLPAMYLASYLFDNPSSAYIRMTFFNVFTGVVSYLVIEVLKTPDVKFTKLSNILDWIFMIFPHYALAVGIKDITMIYTIHSVCDEVIETCLNTKLPNFPELTRLECKILLCRVERKCCTTTRDYFDIEDPGILRNILFLVATGLIGMLILLCIEYGVAKKIYRIVSFRRRNLTTEFQDGYQEDSDVYLERQKVQNANTHDLENTCLVLKNVTKCYGTFPSVKEVSLTVNKFDCFGLLGVNGAGKTTTFKMMTGDIGITSGNAWVCGLSLTTDMARIKKCIGYCPQFDALLENLTVRETLIIYGLIRGISKYRAQTTAVKLAKDFDFYQHLDKEIGNLSGGNKRKVSTALALIGDPVVLYLDEPTTGMDPATKRYLWNCICKVRDSGKCIILTSHSMEECEALCTRLAIMVNGRLTCLGSTQHLKNKFSQSYTLIVKVKRTVGAMESDIERVESYIMQNFCSASIREKHRELITFNISNKELLWSTMFGIMERGKEYLNIEDYSLGQCSLEQVFLTFTKYQLED